jgi:hypothetical protein
MADRHLEGGHVRHGLEPAPDAAAQPYPSLAGHPGPGFRSGDPQSQVPAFERPRGCPRTTCQFEFRLAGRLLLQVVPDAEAKQPHEHQVPPIATRRSYEQILDEHPRLTREAVQAALAFAGEALLADVIHPVAEAVR